jgi:hypothetical protein
VLSADKMCMQICTKLKPVKTVVQSERPAMPIPEEGPRRSVSEELEQVKMFSEKLEFSVKMLLYRKIKCKFKPTVETIINM